MSESSTFPPVFIINLKSSTDRKEHMKDQCQKLGLNPIFIEAVYGKDLTEDELSSHNGEKAQKEIGRSLMTGEIGCALSHKKIYQKIIDENLEVALILEDDAVIFPEVADIIKSIPSLPKHWELLLLGHYADHTEIGEVPSLLSFWEKRALHKYFSVARLAGYGYGTHGYLINYKGAQKLLKELTSIYKPIDHYTSDSKVTNVYALTPTVIKVAQNFDTLIDENAVRGNVKKSLLIEVLTAMRLIAMARVLNRLKKRIKPVIKYK